jgi:hypothetical protein
MRLSFTRPGLALLVSLGIAAFAFVSAQDPGGTPADDQAQAPAGDPQWPRVIEDGGVTFTIYQPQIDKFDDTVLEARAAVQVQTPVDDKTQTTYGVIWIKANTFIDKESGLVQLDDIQITKANFPTAGDKVDQYLDVFRRNVEQGRTISLARIEANLAIAQADKKGNAVPLKNDPPRIYYRTSPAILIMIDGDPVLRDVEGAGLQRVLNSRSLILKDASAFYTPIGDRWVTASTVTGPWRLAASVPPNAQQMRDALAKDENQSQADLLEDPGEDVTALLATGKIPDIIVSTVPAELVVTEGAPDMKPIAGTQILYVANTSGDILLDLSDQNYYVPLTGRWFRAKSLDGPWQFVDGENLPKDFAKIPENNPKSNVLATVPGTPAAQEAVIANSIPQTAEVNREEAKFEANYDGDPQFQAVPDTSLQYAANTPTPVIRVDPTSYYAVQGGVWFMGGSPLGPWVVATAVPPVIYSIPTASPIHYVTYVRIYRYSPTVVWVGYTPGYLGTCYSPWGTVVYGTGWAYRPWIGHYWYGAPMTWGFGVGISWNAWGGWNVGFGWGGYRPIYRPYWGPYYGWHRPPSWNRPVYGRPVYGRPTPYGRPPGMSITNVNVYNRPGIARPGVKPAVVRPAPQPAVRPGTRPAPGTAPGSTRPATRPAPGTTNPSNPSTRPAPGTTNPSNPSTRPAPGTTNPSTRPAPGTTGPTTRPAPSRPDNVYAGTDGNVYRPKPGGSGWEQNDKGKWTSVQPSTRPSTQPPQSRPGTVPQQQPQQPQARPAPQPGRPSVDPGTLNQLSRDQKGRDMGNYRASPPPKQAPQPAPKPQPRPAPQPKPQQPKKPS